MSKMEYMPVDCLQVPKMLFQVEEFKNLIKYSKNFIQLISGSFEICGAEWLGRS
jgi:hypothetical protein